MTRACRDSSAPNTARSSTALIIIAIRSTMPPCRTVPDFGPRLCVASGRNQRRALDERLPQLTNTLYACFVQRRQTRH